MNKYDVFGLSQLIDRGLSRKLDLIENAINKLDPALEPITIVESYAFLANTSNGELFRIRFDESEGVVSFSEPTKFEIDTDTSRFERQSKKIVREIVESLSNEDDSDAEFFKGKWLANQRQKNLLETKLDITVGTRSQYITNAKKYVAEAIKSTRGARSLVSKGRSDSLFSQLLAEGTIAVVESEPREIDIEQSRKQLVYQHIVDVRAKAKELVESPLFVEYANNLYEGTDVDEAVEFISENYQEIYALSLSEQTELLYAVVEAQITDKPILTQVVESIMSIGKYAMASEEISEQIDKLASLVGATNGNYHERMQLIEDEINTRTYTNNDIKILSTVLESILVQPSEFLAPEFIVECRRVFRRVQTMVESGTVDDAVVASAIHLISQFYPQPIGESKKKGEGDGDKYKAFIDKKLKKYGVDSPADLGDKKDDFFKEVEKEWTSEDPKTDDGDEKSGEEDKNIYNESVDSQTGFPKGVLESLLEKEEAPEEDEEEEEMGNVEDFKKKAKSAKSIEDIEKLETDMKKAKKKMSSDDAEGIEDIQDELAAKKLTV